MQTRIIRGFIFSAAALLFITAAAKLVSAFGNARVLEVADPILGLSFRWVFILVGVLELFIAGVCVFGRNLQIQSILVAWLGSAFVAYRLGLVWMGYQKPCSCLGSLTDALHISPQMADSMMKGVLAYLLVGSYASLITLWKRRHAAGPTAVNAMAS